MRTTPNAQGTDWALLSETLLSLSKKHGQLKQAVTKMVQLAMLYLSPPVAPVDVATVVEKKDEDEEMKDAEVGAEKKAEKKEEKKSEEKKRKPGEEAELTDKGEGLEAPAVTTLMNEARKVANQGVSQEKRLELIETLRTVTEGKVSGIFQRRAAASQLAGLAHSSCHFADLRRSRASARNTHASRRTVRQGRRSGRG